MVGKEVEKGILNDFFNEGRYGALLYEVMDVEEVTFFSFTGGESENLERKKEEKETF
jgi:hypothetical protein